MEPPPPKPVKLLVFAQSLPGRGTDQALIRLLQHWDRSLLAPVLVLVKGGGRFLERVPHDVPVIDLELGERKTSRAYFKLWRIVRRINPDCVLGVHTPPGRVAALLRLVRPRLRVVCLEADPFVRNEGGRGFFILRKLTTRLAHRLAFRIVAVSEVVTADFAYIGTSMEKVTMIPHPCVDAELLGAMIVDVEEDPYSSSNSPIVLSVGNMFKEKGQSTLIRAFAEMGATHPAQLVIIGEGPLRDELESLARELGIADRTWFFGFKDNPYKFMARSDVFVSPSVSEGFDIAQVEAMACGVCVIVTDAPRYKAVDHGINGLVVPTGQPAEMAQALNLVLDNKALRMKLVKSAKLTAKQFEAGRIARLYEAVLLDASRRSDEGTR